MRILVDIAHPAHVHFFKNFIRAVESHGHEVRITARDKEVTLNLLKIYGFDFVNRGRIRESLLGKALALASVNLKLLGVARKFRPDILLGVHNPYVAQVGKLIGKPSVIFTDTEGVGIASRLTWPFADVICTPSCFRENLDPKKQVRFNGYKELAYLHPRYFQPDPGVVEDLGHSRNDPFIVVRFISWGASHDLSLSGIREEEKTDLIRSLEKYGRVFITSEKKLSPGLEKYRISVSPEKIHSLLFYARLYIGEGGTMATEAAVLGTPSIHIEALPSGRPSGEIYGNFLELRDRYQLLSFYAGAGEALNMASEILDDPDSRAEWQRKREILLKDKADVTAWMTDFVERYPESFTEYMRSHV